MNLWLFLWLYHMHEHESYFHRDFPAAVAAVCFYPHEWWNSALQWGSEALNKVTGHTMGGEVLFLKGAIKCFCRTLGEIFIGYYL